MNLYTHSHTRLPLRVRHTQTHKQTQITIHTTLVRALLYTTSSLLPPKIVFVCAQLFGQVHFRTITDAPRPRQQNYINAILVLPTRSQMADRRGRDACPFQITVPTDCLCICPSRAVRGCPALGNKKWFDFSRRRVSHRRFQHVVY